MTTEKLVSRDLRRVLAWMTRLHGIHGIWFTNLGWWELYPGSRSGFPSSSSVSVDDWSEAIEAAEALGL